MLKANRIERGFLERYPDRIVTVDSHTQGEPTRLVIGGVGSIPGAAIRDKREHFAAHRDSVRRLLTREPRGHRGIMAAVVTEPVSPGAHFGLFYMDARRYPFLCGHATIGAVATLVGTGGLSFPDGETVVTVDSPSGPLHAHTRIRGGKVVSVGLEMVPAFVFDTGRVLEVEGFGRVPVDLVCVGGFFAMVSAADAGVDFAPANRPRLVAMGMAVIAAANEQIEVRHPLRPEVTTVDVTEFHDTDATGTAGRNVVVYGESHMDRSPCGTGTTAKMTLLHHRGRLDVGQTYRNAGPLGTVFEGCVKRTQSVGGLEAVVCEIRGHAQITGYHQFVVDPDDPLPEGFLL